MRKFSSSLLTGLVLLLGASVLLAGCASEDGEMLSDEEKIKKSHEGRAEYEKARQGGAPGTAPGASTAGK